MIKQQFVSYLRFDMCTLEFHLNAFYDSTDREKREAVQIVVKQNRQRDIRQYFS